MDQKGQTVEEWRPVVGHEDTYEVSDLGRVRSVPRRVRSRGGHRVTRGRVLSPRPGYAGYVRVTMNGPSRRAARVHRLVLEAFRGPCPPGGVCRHLNGDPADNRLVNLVWGTQVENMADCLRHGRSNRGSRHGNSKLDAAQARRVKFGSDPADRLARELGIRPETVRHIRNGTRWGWLTEDGA